MSERIFFLDDNGELRDLVETYESESKLQKLLAAHPEVMAGEQIDASDPRRWLLIQRELGVPGDEESGSPELFPWPWQRQKIDEWLSAFGYRMVR